MVKASIYGLALLMNVEKFGINYQHKTNIQEAISLILKSQSQYLLDKIGINDKLEGWQKLIRDFCIKNELMDVKNINVPDFSKEMKNDKDYYVYASYLKPGYH